MDKNRALLVFALLAVTAFGDPVDEVDPFIGTSGTGHTTPAACVPFGLIQAGPDTGNGDWDHCSGYAYGDTKLYGFSQTHLSGTGCADLGDVRLLPFVGEEIPEYLPLDKSTERASPGYYTATALGIKTEVTATTRVASYRFTYPKGAKKRLLVDTQWGLYNWGAATNRVLSAVVTITNKTIAGTLLVRQWNERKVSFVVQPDLRSSPPVKSITELSRRPGEKAPRFVLDFADGDAPVFVDVALSVNSVDAARMNLESDHYHFRHLDQGLNPARFDNIRTEARRRWNETLSAATIEGTDEQKKNWYTSLYHLCVQPNEISDYNVYASARLPSIYSTFSTWDTFRAAGPLYTILYPARAKEFVESMLWQGEKSGYLPIWTLWGSDNQCMIGTHSIPMIVDWYLKDKEASNSIPQLEMTTSYWKSAYRLIKATLTEKHENRDRENWELYDRYGYYPFDLIKGESVSRTLECAYDDWCAAQMAERLGYREDAEAFLKRSAYWKNVFDRSIGFARPRDTQGAWKDPYDPLAYPSIDAWDQGDFTEGNAFQYSWHIMQDLQGLVEMLGGREKALAKLDALFSQPPQTGNAVRDVSGLVGQYVHGNEPSHHVIYFYPQLGAPHRAAERIREVFDRFYLPKSDGLCGNDDCGQMSAWYLFSAMGFYPFNPCGGEYIIGAPQVPQVAVKVNGRSGQRILMIIAKNLSQENKYVKSVALNGRPITDWKLRHADLMNGGELVFEMTNHP